MFKTNEAEELRTDYHALDHTLDHCMYEREYKKRTHLLRNAAVKDILKECNHGSGAH